MLLLKFIDFIIITLLQLIAFAVMVVMLFFGAPFLYYHIAQNHPDLLPHFGPGLIVFVSYPGYFIVKGIVRGFLYSFFGFRCYTEQEMSDMKIREMVVQAKRNRYGKPTDLSKPDVIVVSDKEEGQDFEEMTRKLKALNQQVDDIRNRKKRRRAS